jgi:hypothetical protein
VIQEECWWILERTTKFQGQGPCLTLTTTYQDKKAIRKVGSLEARSIPHCETNKCCGFLTQDSKFYENPFCVSCFLITTLPRVYDYRKDPWSPSTYQNWLLTKVWSGGHFKFKDFELSTLIFCSLAWVWCEWTHLGTNQEPIECHGKSTWVSLTIFKQTQVHPLWNSLIEGEVMSWMLMSWSLFIWMFIHDLYWIYT